MCGKCGHPKGHYYSSRYAAVSLMYRCICFWYLQRQHTTNVNWFIPDSSSNNSLSRQELFKYKTYPNIIFLALFETHHVAGTLRWPVISINHAVASLDDWLLTLHLMYISIIPLFILLILLRLAGQKRMTCRVHAWFFWKKITEACWRLKAQH